MTSVDVKLRDPVEVARRLLVLGYHGVLGSGFSMPIYAKTLLSGLFIGRAHSGGRNERVRCRIGLRLRSTHRS